MTELDRRPVHLARAAGLALLVALAACSGGGSEEARSPGTDASATVVASTSAAPITATTETIETTAPPTTRWSVDGPAVLAAAVAQLGGGYHFTSTVTVADQVVLVAEGDRIGTGTRLSVTRDATMVSYVILPEATWIQVDGQWQQLDSPAAATDPIAALAAPLAVTVESDDGTSTVLSASVSPDSLGLAGDEAVALTVGLHRGALQEVSYVSEASGSTSAVRALIGPPADATPVVPPV